MAVAVRRRAGSEVVQAVCLASDDVRDVVRISGPPLGGKYQVAKLNIDANPTEVAFGVIISKDSATQCAVQLSGQVAQLYTGLTPGATMFVGIDGKLTHSIPIAPSVGVRSVHHAAMALAGDVLLLRFHAPTRRII